MFKLQIKRVEPATPLFLLPVPPLGVMNVKGSLEVNADDIKSTSIWTTGSGTTYGLPEADGILETIGTPNGWIKAAQRFTAYNGNLYVRSLQSDGVTWTIWRSVAFR